MPPCYFDTKWRTNSLTLLLSPVTHEPILLSGYHKITQLLLQSIYLYNIYKYIISNDFWLGPTMAMVDQRVILFSWFWDFSGSSPPCLFACLLVFSVRRPGVYPDPPWEGDYLFFVGRPGVSWLPFYRLLIKIKTAKAYLSYTNS